MTTVAWFILLAAATLEVVGDAVIRKGLRGSIIWFIVAGFLMLGAYGVGNYGKMGTSPGSWGSMSPSLP